MRVLGLTHAGGHSDERIGMILKKVERIIEQRCMLMIFFISCTALTHSNSLTQIGPMLMVFEEGLFLSKSGTTEEIVLSILSITKNLYPVFASNA